MHDDVLILSALPKTWIFDLDGTVVRHNGYLTDGEDTLLESAREFLDSVPKTDTVVFLTSRGPELEEETVGFLDRNGIRHDHIVFGLPAGERILVNDRKPSGLATAYAINVDRDSSGFPDVRIDGGLRCSRSAGA